MGISSTLLGGVPINQLSWQTSWRPNWPEGAIGYEVEQREYGPGWWVGAGRIKAVDVTVTLTPRHGSAGGVEGANIGVIGSGVTQVGIRGVEKIGTPVFTLSTGLWEIPVRNNITGLASLLSPPLVSSFDSPLSTTVRIEDFQDNNPYGPLGYVQLVWGPQWADEATEVTYPNGDVQTNVSRGHLLDRTAVYWFTPPRIRWIYEEPQEVGRLKLNLGDDGVRQWKYFNPQPGENGGQGVGFVNTGTDEVRNWQRLTPRTVINIGTEDNHFS